MRKVSIYVLWALLPTLAQSKITNQLAVASIQLGTTVTESNPQLVKNHNEGLLAYITNEYSGFLSSFLNADYANATNAGLAEVTITETQIFWKSASSNSVSVATSGASAASTVLFDFGINFSNSTKKCYILEGNISRFASSSNLPMQYAVDLQLPTNFIYWSFPSQTSQTNFYAFGVADPGAYFLGVSAVSELTISYLTNNSLIESFEVSFTLFDYQINSFSSFDPTGRLATSHQFPGTDTTLLKTTNLLTGPWSSVSNHIETTNLQYFYLQPNNSNIVEYFKTAIQ